jgi:hypothetical protein
MSQAEKNDEVRSVGYTVADMLQTEAGRTKYWINIKPLTSE